MPEPKYSGGNRAANRLPLARVSLDGWRALATSIALLAILAFQDACSRPERGAGAQEARAEAPKPRATGGGKPMFKMPGESFKGALPALSEHQQQLRDSLRRDVKLLAQDIGERNIARPRQLAAAAAAIDKALVAAGFKVERQTMQVHGRPCDNLQAEISGTDRPKEIVVVGAHYDSVMGAPGANDNASGVAGLLALARSMAGQKTGRTLRFVAFVNEEPPYFQTELMGSLAYAKRAHERRENIVAMICLETIGYFSDAPGSQKYPAAFSQFYPSTGNLIGFVGNIDSAPLVQQVVASFRRHAKFPSEGGALPPVIDGVGWSDHWSFWQYGYPALMVTDTALFRYPHYHTAGDTPDKLSYDRMARIVSGLEKVVEELAAGK